MDRNGCSIGTHILSYKPRNIKNRALHIVAQNSANR